MEATRNLLFMWSMGGANLATPEMVWQEPQGMCLRRVCVTHASYGLRPYQNTIRAACKEHHRAFCKHLPRSLHGQSRSTGQPGTGGHCSNRQCTGAGAVACAVFGQKGRV